MKLIYMVDDDFDIIHLISRRLRERFYEVRGFSTSEHLFKGIEMQKPNLILLDVMLGKEDGREVCERVRQLYEHSIPVILFSGAYNSLKELGKTCADSFLKKSESMETLLQRLDEYTRLD